MSLSKRLAWVEAHLLAPPGCATCRSWTGVVLAGEDGVHSPEQCPGCGRVVPATLVVRMEGVALAAV